MILPPVLFFAASMHLTVAQAECPDFGLSTEESSEFCKEFSELLYAPYNPGGNRSAAGENGKRYDWVIESDPMWAEVYRSDPRRTLALIERIRDAGGLPR